MKFVRKIFSRRALAILGVIALALLIWFGGPLIGIAGFHPLESLWPRVVLVAAVVIYFVARRVWKLVQAKRANSSLASGLIAQSDSVQSPAPAGVTEVALLRSRLEEAISLLKQSKRQKGGRLASLGGQFLYELPWYMFIGAPGAGKTTALVNSGLHFPLAERFGYEAISGVGGTRNCDWWFTDEAVLLDTAGRYSTQDSNQQADSAAWTGFLKLLAKYRPRRPLNGIIVTVSVSDLVQQTPAQLEIHAGAVRSRVQELHELLGVRFPIYVLVSKADLLPGFTEFFDTFGREERAQVWGTTFPLAQQGQDVLSQFNARFAELEERLNARLTDRLQDEREVSRRALVYTFPQQFSALREPLGHFLTRVFSPSRYETQPLVRGVYFTSATQEGTPIDRIVGSLGRALRLDRSMTEPQRPTGKSFFITRLFKDVIFHEAGLSGTNLRWERRRGIVQWGAFAAAGTLTLLLLVAWGVSFIRNRAYIAEVDARAQRVAQDVSAISPTRSADLLEIAPPLRSVRDLAKFGASSDGSVPLSMQVGLYQGDKLNSAANIGYTGLLQSAFLPRVAARIEHQLRTRGQQNLDLLYEALKAYVMLSDRAHFDPAALKAYVTAELEVTLPREVTAEQRRELESHLDALLASGPVASPYGPDNKLIAAARDAIARTPTSQRVYNRLKHHGGAADIPEFTVLKAAGPAASAVFARKSGESLGKGVPGFFSHDAYHKLFAAPVEQLTMQLLAEEPWVLGLEPRKPGQAVDAQTKERLANEVRRLYLEEYVRIWDAFIRDIGFVGTDNPQQTIALTRRLSAPDSPLPILMRATAREVTLGKTEEPPRAEKSTMDAAAEVIKKKRDDLLNMFGRSGEQPRGSPAVRTESVVDEHFRELRRMVRSPAQGQPAPIDAAVGLIGEMYKQLINAESAGSAPPADVAGNVKAEVGRMPEPLQSMLTSLANSAGKQVREGTRSNWSSELAPIAEFCRKAIEGRYPFSRGSAMDVTQDDFAQLFAPGRLLDEFFKSKLAQSVDTAVKPWRFRKVGDGTGAEASAALVQFQRAQTIRSVFFRNGQVPTTTLQFKPVSLDATLAEISIDFDGQLLKYSHGTPIPATVVWPGPKGTFQIRVNAASATGNAAAGLLFEGPWALFRMLDKAQVQPTSQPEKLIVTLSLEGRRSQFEVLSSSVQNPLRLPDLEQFRCPGKL